MATWCRPGTPSGWGGAPPGFQGFTLRGGEAEVVVVAAGRDKQHVAGRAPARNVARLGDDVEPQHPDVEVADAVDVRGAQVDVADGHAGVDRPRARRDRGDVALQGVAHTVDMMKLRLPRVTADVSYLRTSRDLRLLI